MKEITEPSAIEQIQSHMDEIVTILQKSDGIGGVSAYVDELGTANIRLYRSGDAIRIWNRDEAGKWRRAKKPSY